MGEEGTNGGAMVDPGRDSFPTILMEQPDITPEPEPEGGKETPPVSFKDAPEFKEVSERASKAEERAARLEAQLNGFMNARGEQKDPEQKLDFEDLSALKPEDLRERWDTDPHAILGNLLRQARHEIRQELMGEITHQSTRERQNSGLQAFVKEMPEFLTEYQSGALNDILQTNPIHSPVSAYLYRAMQNLKANSVSKEDHEKALKEAEEKGRKEGQRSSLIKDGARVLSNGPARHPANYQPDKLKSEHHGGDSTQALLARHRARKEAMG